MPTHRLYVISFSPSTLWLVASTGQTTSHGVFSQCMHGSGWKYVSGSAAVSGFFSSVTKYVSMRIQCMFRSASTWSLPTTGMLFSLWQATTHALHPMQAVRSMTMAHAG